VTSVEDKANTFLSSKLGGPVGLDRVMLRTWREGN